MITFVYRTGFKDRKNADHFKPARLNAAKKNSVLQSNKTLGARGDIGSANKNKLEEGW